MQPVQTLSTASTPGSLAPRQPMVAAVASLVLPGFGQFYNGDLNRAIWLFLSFALLCIPGVALIALYLPDRLMLPTLLLGLGVTLGVWVYAVRDAWRGARRNVDTMAKAWQMSGVYALVFVAFAVDVLFLIPVAVVYNRQFPIRDFVEMLIFVGILSLVIVYAWKKGIFEWKPRKTVPRS